MRVLDLDGNTLIKVRFGVGVVGSTAGIESSPYAEELLEDPAYVKQLLEMPQQELSFRLLPRSRWDFEEDPRGPVMHEAIYPLALEGKIPGVLKASW